MNILNKEKCNWTDQTSFDFLKEEYAHKWQFLFMIADLGNLNKPLTPKILGNPNHRITKHILYLYSMESFIYQDLNRACRNQDKDEI